MRRRTSWLLAIAAAAVAAAGVVWAWSDAGLPAPRVLATTPLAEAPPPPDSVSGTLVRFDHVVPGAFIDAAEPGRTVRLETDGEAPRTTTTDAWGAFTIAGVTPLRRHDLVIEAEGRGTIRVAGIVLLPGERRDVGLLKLGVPGATKIPVTDEEGRPLAGAVVEAFGERSDRGWESGFYVPADDLMFEASPSARAVTGPDGIAELQLAGWRTWTFVAKAPGKARMAAPTNRVVGARLALPDPVPVRGTVRDAAGRPVASALVLARLRPPIMDAHHGARYDAACRWQRTTAAADGTFAFDDLPPGVIDLLAGPPGAAPFATACIRTPDVTEAEIAVPGLARVRGRITDEESGAPLAGIVVSAQERDLGTGWRCVTDADGRYEFAAPATGSWKHLTVEEPRTRRPPARVSLKCEVLAPGEERILDDRLRRERAGVLIGRVPAARSPDEGLRVCVFERSDDGSVVGGRPVLIDADGRFRIDGLEAGRFAVFASEVTELWSRDDETWSGIQERLEAEPRLFDRMSFDLPAEHVVEVELDTVPPAPLLPEYDLPPSPTERKVAVRVRVRTADGLPLRNGWTYVTTESAPEPDSPRAPGAGRNACCSSSDRSSAEARHRPVWTPSFGRAIGPDGAHEETEQASPGDWIWAVAADDRHGQAQAHGVVPTEGGVELELVLPPPTVLAGRVVADGRPVAGALVFVDGAACTRTAADGTFASSSDDDRPRLRVEAPGFEPWDGPARVLPPADPQAGPFTIELKPR